MKIEKISDIYEVLKGYTRKKRLVVAFANDSHSIEAVYMAVKAGLVEGILVGDTETIQGVCKENGYDESCFKIVHERGLVAPNAILSHVTVMECSSYHKLLTVSDVAVIPCPDLNQKISMIKYVTITARALGVEKPKVAMIAPTEQVLPKVQSTVDAAILSKMGERGQIPGCIIEGPMALDVAVDKEAAEIKKMQSVVAGDADCLIFPNLESGNVFYKTNTKLGHSKQGAVLVGAKVPSVLSSRGDSVETKLNSIALAAILSE